MCQAAALLAARHLPQWEVIDYASATKPDVPSGTAREGPLAQLRRVDRGRVRPARRALTIRHDAGGTPDPYVLGTLIAVRAAPALVGVTRGLDTLVLASDRSA